MAELISHAGAADGGESIDLADRYGPLRLVNGPRPDRLPPMLFLAALIHGILIIGITFNAVIGDYFSEAVSLEVTIVADPESNFDRLDDAMYLAQASQEGSGNTEQLTRPGAPLESSVPIDNKISNRCFESGHRRGLTLIQSLMDEVSYNSRGNEMTMRKRTACAP